MKKRKVIVCCIAGVLILISAIAAYFGITFLRTTLSLEKAINPSNYDLLQINVKRDLDYIKNENSDDKNNQNKRTEEYNIAIDGDVTYEYFSTVKRYFHSIDGEEYVTYFYDMYGALDEGYWIKRKQSEMPKQTIDIKDFANLSVSDFDVKDGRYVIKQESLERAIKVIFNTDYPEDYRDMQISISVSKDRIADIEMTYLYREMCNIKSKYTFDYLEMPLEVPQGQNYNNEI